MVTGASTGIGAATARELARRGFHVLAGVRRANDADAVRTERIEPHILDTTVAGDVAAIAERVAQDPQRRPLHALVNNAGIAVNAPVEALPMAQWRWQFEVNLFGHIAMTQALLPALIDSSGTVVNISSIGGKVAMATYGAYAGTKFALEAVSDTLRREVAQFGVKVVVVEPGGVATQMASRGIALIGAITAQADAFTKAGVPAERAAAVIAQAVTARNPRTRYTVGRDAAIIAKLARVAPDRFLRRNLTPHYAAATP